MNADLVEVVAKTRNLFLDFDGPICSIFAGYPAPTVAAELRELLSRLDAPAAALLAELDDADDPMRVLRVAGDLGDQAITRTIANALRDAEVTAARSAKPTPFVDDVVHAALESGRLLAVVSNNSAAAVAAYLDRVGLLSSFVRVVGRYDGMSAAYMKPSNHLIGLALIGTGSPPWSTTLVGDTVSDIVAARSVPVASIGYANKHGKEAALAEAGADAVITDMKQLADALASTPYMPSSPAS